VVERYIEATHMDMTFGLLSSPSVVSNYSTCGTLRMSIAHCVQVGKNNTIHGLHLIGLMRRPGPARSLCTYPKVRGDM
jgi:hypothetical protein